MLQLLRELTLRENWGWNTSMSEETFWEKCLRCHCLGKIDREQEAGTVSCICPTCGFHYYKTPDKRLQPDFKKDEDEFEDPRERHELEDK